ncbi:MAG TPA: inositol monophosphatase [Elusimicrobia bacterium]|nr:MAG: hypothetical protein A2278_01335 [Elusimicrobia bacterium RIFOXYA12_FULL_49_49]OGS09906.1 MAG: hypothetical protein A2204_07125 [Elusimicrobia bacterium RIFOXYA1_FULL_47_7]OGS10011.1 MAG: hypothetical protein A2386_05920 [Elusimicrobia bacterium RIFOXYB1_FULL_48_9]OGS15481.1 MAG: hypothetical protein A2251_03070 [Elusimicrobia bacterium RIFOXYA2_FULL_47_53]OGS26976.1 MAG: hypothetical protein A2339_04585 [Elusimicrobia bacterium RIFOXYB12_FULL_50_12]OGS30921.1 MAG: hypothetical protein
MKPNQYTKSAVIAATAAGKVLLKYFNKPIEINYKGKIDPVTVADRSSQDTIIRILKRKFPAHSFMGEEGEQKEIKGDYCWIIDPLDGTVNYIHGLPIFSVSIGLRYKNEMVSAVVYAPALKELFVAQKGAGAFLNGKKIRVSAKSELIKSLAVTGFPYYVHSDNKRPLKIFSNVLTKVQGMRRLGSAAIDLCYVACGRLDFFWEEGLKAWDIAAGSLILKEAGGKISSYGNTPDFLFGQTMAASNGRLHKAIIKLIN